MADENERRRLVEYQRRRQQERNGITKNTYMKDSGLGDVIDYAAMGLVGGAASAALLFRTSLGPSVKRALDFGVRFADNIQKDIPDLMIEDWDIDVVNKLRNSIKDVAKKTWDDVKLHPIRIDPKDKRTLWGYNADVESLLENDGEKLARKIWTNEKVIAPTLEYVDEVGKKNDWSENTVKLAKEYAAKVGKSDQYSTVYEGFNSGLSDEIVDLIDNRVRQLQNKEADGRKEVWEEVRARASAMAREIREKAYDINELERTFGSEGHDALTDYARDLVSNSRAATVKDILKATENGNPVSEALYYTNKKMDEGREAINRLKGMQDYYREYDKINGTNFEERFLNLRPDASGLRVSADGSIYSSNAVRKTLDVFTDAAASTLPGKILKMRDINYVRNMPRITSFTKGAYDPVQAALVNDENNRKSHYLDSDTIRINDKIYKFDELGNFVKYENGNAKEFIGAGETRLISGDHGTAQHLMHQMAGDVRHVEAKGFWARLLGIGEDRETYTGKLTNLSFNSIVGKYSNPDYIKNIANSLMNASFGEELQEAAILNDDGIKNSQTSGKYIRRKIYEAMRHMSWMEKRTYGLSREDAEKLAGATQDENARTIYNLLAKGSHEDLVEFLMRLNTDPRSQKKEALDSARKAGINYSMILRPGIIDNRVLKLARKYRNNFSAAEDSIEQVVNESRDHLEGSLPSLINAKHDTQILKADEILRRALSRQALLFEMGGHNADKYSVMLDVFEKAGLDKKAASKAERLAQLARLQSSIIPATDASGTLLGAVNTHTLERITDAYRGAGKNDIAISRLKKINDEMQNEYSSFLTPFDDGAEKIGKNITDADYLTVRTTLSPLDIIRSINESTRRNANYKRLDATRIVTQFFAGRDNLDQVSLGTMAPYMMLSRLSDEVNQHFGLGLSSSDMGSFGSQVKAIAFKRVLPVWLAANYFEYANDASQAAFGMSMTGAMAQGVANVDLAFRKTADMVGLGDWLKGEKQLNPIMQYWGDHNDYQNFEERKRWYAEGYEPVRKGAWWTFGGVNEARGSEIQYWTPSFARRIQSDYEDKSLYNGFLDKWSHSILPTPTNPLSPIAAILDPYWLEERHKDDRPYLLTGHMFSEGTPWGAVLNNTIGDIIKPQKDLHSFLGFHYRNFNGVDPLSLAHAANMYIKQKARDLAGLNYIQLHGDDASPISFDPYGAPGDSSTQVLSYSFKNGTLTNINETGYTAVAIGGSYGSLKGAAGGYGLGPGGAPDGIPSGGTMATGPNYQSFIDLANTRGYRSTAAVMRLIGEDEHYSIGGVIRQFLIGDTGEMRGNFVGTDEEGNVGVYTRRNYVDEDQVRKFKYNVEQLTGEDLSHIGQAAHKLKHFADPTNWIEILNNGIKDKAAVRPFNSASDDLAESELADEGLVTSLKLKNYRPTDAMNFLNDTDTVIQLINQGKGGDLVKEAAISWRLVSGIYGYGVGEATGFGVDNQKIMATGADMTSFSRTFWDQNLGGLGGGVAEIARRFVPDFRRGNRVNPLMNDMPDWMAERFRYGDPFTLVPRGESRLPGKGYEALNELHPDSYGRYGAFDRMKILADVAPFSPEYRMWRDIAEKTVTDPKLIEDMKDIRERVNQQGKKHDFYEYKIAGHDFEYANVVVSEVLGYGKFRSGNTIFKLAGVSVNGNANESMTEVLGRYIHPGQEITVAVSSSQYDRRNRDSIESIDAVAFIGGENVNKQMIDAGDASIRKGDTSSALLANYGVTQRGIGYVSELIAHMDIPWLSDQYLRVRTPLDAYKAEEVYGTSYQSWSHPINTIVQPAFERAMHDRTALTPLIGMAARYIKSEPGLSKTQHHLVNVAYMLSDRGAFVGGAMAYALRPDKANSVLRWARHSSALATAGHFLTGGNSYLDEITSGAGLGAEAARFFKRSKIFGAAVGAAVGTAYRTVAGDSGDWIPERIKKKWEMVDYFDRLTYLKYTGLFHQAAKKAKEEEGVDIEEVLKQREEREEKNRNAIHLLKSLKARLQKGAHPSDERSRLMGILNKKLEYLSGETMLLPGGEWTRTALIYKKAADTTMRGLKEGASWAQIIGALPTNDREFFMEFVKERDPEKRDEILRFASPALKKALAISWGKKPPKEKTDEQFFARHRLPTAEWGGWRPDVDLKDVEVKTIENEGMNLADFGLYDSQLRDADVANAPETDYDNNDQGKNVAAVKGNLEKILRGQGLRDVDISVMPGPAGGGTAIVAAIKTMLGMRAAERQVSDSLAAQL